ncbi:TPA: hypothetical protein O7P84_004867 [Escherichia coli]|uniref:hypothetical protein n=1 Tax=Escherichia coli TaxID=562 RepID=UPI0013EF07B5|nr:hypothetical protein [Escherichia coli]EIQ7189146.1 hypothetical protein [Escherichia coli]WIX74827.1 hypothetical protein QRM69_25360 [Escherichia coli]HAZ8330023.1 hypothetical protein [Escherichia coli]HAZ8330477.1 hypothetical protein [Escherichia coli]HCN1290653.1 hypothetical protein [Escherichia coli]
MAKIYQFPQGDERGKFREEIARERKKRFAVKTGSTFVKWLGWTGSDAQWNENSR